MTATGEKLHILMVDDSPANLLVMERALRKLDIEIIKAESGHEALEKAGEHDYALVLLDMHMPDLSGIQVAHELARREDRHQIPIIFITGATGDEETLFQGYEAGAVDYLYKPVDPRVLLSKVSVFCRMKEQNALIASQLKDLEKEMDERRQAELRHRESEMRYRILLELSPVAVCVHVENEIQYINRAMLDLLQAENRDEFIGKPPHIFVAKEELERFDTFNEQLMRMAGTPRNFEMGFVRRDGTEVEVDIRGACVPYEDGWGVQLAVQDITERKQLEHQLKLSATRDGLTGIPNRRAFDEALETEWKRGLREEMSLALIMADVDHFKTFNDNHGHQAGDECLKKVAVALCGVARRASDVIARYGGEEFAAVLPNTDLAGAQRVAEAMRECIAALEIVHGFSGAGPNVTASFGVAAVVPGANGSFESLLKEADTALYHAKDSGRDRVASAAPVEEQGAQ